MTSETKKTLKKTLSIVGNVLLWLFVAFSLLITVLVFSAQGNEDGVPSLFGKSWITISSNSMADTYGQGDLVFMEKLSEKEKASLKEGDIITYWATELDINQDGITGNDLNTHRIVGFENGEIITKGDNNTHADNKDKLHPYTVDMKDVVGKCTEDGKLPMVGGILSWLRSPLGFFLCVVLPLILFFLYELYNFISIIVAERAKKKPVSTEEEEAIKRRAIEEYLAAQESAKEVTPAAEAPDPVPEVTPEDETPTAEAETEESKEASDN